MEEEEEEKGTLNSQTDFQTIFSEPVAIIQCCGLTV
jgi:hypothetical protein